MAVEAVRHISIKSEGGGKISTSEGVLPRSTNQLIDIGEIGGYGKAGTRARKAIIIYITFCTDSDRDRVRRSVSSIGENISAVLTVNMTFEVDPAGNLEDVNIGGTDQVFCGFEFKGIVHVPRASAGNMEGLTGCMALKLILVRGGADIFIHLGKANRETRGAPRITVHNSSDQYHTAGPGVLAVIQDVVTTVTH